MKKMNFVPSWYANHLNQPKEKIIKIFLCVTLILIAIIFSISYRVYDEMVQYTEMKLQISQNQNMVKDVKELEKIIKIIDLSNAIRINVVDAQIEDGKVIIRIKEDKESDTINFINELDSKKFSLEKINKYVLEGEKITEVVVR